MPDPEGPAISAQGAGCVLVVDDNIINRKQLSRLLADQGYSVTLAEDGRQAVVLLEQQTKRVVGEHGASFDVILLDILMPEMDGYQVLAYVKGQPRLRHIPVIMISALEEMESVVRCVELGATDYLPKPFKPTLLQARLRTSLAEKRLRDLEVEYLLQVQRITGAAAAVEAGAFDPTCLDEVAGRQDALGQLGRVFQRMASEIYAREHSLKQQVQALRIEIDQAKKAREVAEITESDYFRQLKERAQRLRKAECD
jgi:two-component system, cell cycle response regulator